MRRQQPGLAAKRHKFAAEVLGGAVRGLPRVAFQRNDLVADEGARALLQFLQFGREGEVHRDTAPDQNARPWAISWANSRMPVPIAVRPRVARFGGRAAAVAIAKLQEDHAELVHRQHAVEQKVGHIAAGQRGIARHRLLARPEAAFVGRHLRHVVHRPRIVGVHPVAQQRGEIEQRIAARALVPVDHRDRRQIARVQDHVVQLEVVVQQRRLAVRHQMLLQPGAQFRVQRLGAGLHRRQAALAPAGDRARQKTVRAGRDRPARPRRYPPRGSPRWSPAAPATAARRLPAGRQAPAACVRGSPAPAGIR